MATPVTAACVASAGARDDPGLELRLRPGPSLACVGAVTVLAACGGTARTRPPDRLLDGSQPPTLPGALRSLQGAVVSTKMRAVPARAGGPRLRACLVRFSPLRVQPTTLLVERVGLVSSSLTFRVGASVYGCDATAGPKELPGPWCGSEVGRADPATFDPRLNILCRDKQRRLIGLAWIQPDTGVRYVIVREHGYSEAYTVVGRLPLRVPTSDVDPSTSSATFRVEQYDSHGRRLARRKLRAVVAG